MPLLHISLRAGKPEAYRQAIFDGLYRAMRETFNVPDDDQSMSIAAHAAALRIEHARDLLNGDRQSVSEIAATLRFATPSAFSAAFRRATGETPNGFRQRTRRTML